MGKLIDKIERGQQSSGPRLGFAPASASKGPSMLLVAVLPAGDAALAASAVEKGADAVLVKGGDLPTGRTAAVGAVWSDRGGRVAGDFAVITDRDASVAPLLEAEDFDVVLSLDFDMPDTELRTLEALPMNVFIVPDLGEPLTTKKLIALLRVTRATSKPVLTYCSAGAGKAALVALRDAGIAGFLIEVPKTSAVGGLAQLRKTLDGLPQRKKNRNRSRETASLGMGYNMGSSPERRPAKPDEDDDDEP